MLAAKIYHLELILYHLPKKASITILIYDIFMMSRGGENVKIRIEVTNSIDEDEVVIRCKELTDTIGKIQKAITEKASKVTNMAFYKDKDEYYFPLSDVMFFESDKDRIFAHTATDIFSTEYKLYELLRFLPDRFVRISKSAIVNTVHILSISRNITSSSLIRFHKSHKQIYVSRFYYKDLKEKMNNRSLSI